MSDAILIEEEEENILRLSDEIKKLMPVDGTIHWTFTPDQPPKPKMKPGTFRQECTAGFTTWDIISRGDNE